MEMMARHRHCHRHRIHTERERECEKYNGFTLEKYEPKRA